ncbi:MAG: Fe-S cluster assembly sulfur transfer protein SufU [candidate division WOR-3 bacterium]
MNIYPEKVMEHIKEPRHAGRIEDPTVIGDSGNPSCGDELTYYIKLEGDRISDIKHDARGCAISRAAADILADMVLGKSISEALSLTHDDIVKELGGISEARRACATLSVDVLREALGNL